MAGASFSLSLRSEYYKNIRNDTRNECRVTKSLFRSLAFLRKKKGQQIT